MRPFRRKRSIEVITQSEHAECGLACIVMMANYFGHRIDLPSARRHCQPTLRGASLPQMISLAGEFDMAAKPLRVEIGALEKLALPCILHWRFNHFVILERVHADGGLRIVDPSHGRIDVPASEASRSFTGVALGLSPAASFQPRELAIDVRLSDLLGGWRRLASLSLPALLPIFFLEVINLVLPIAYKQFLGTGTQGTPGHFEVLAASIGLVVCGGLFYALRSVLINRAAALSMGPSAGKLFAHLLRIPYRFFESRNASDIISRFGSLNFIHRSVTARTLDFAIDGVLCLFLIGALAMISGVAAVVILSAITVALLIYRMFSEKLVAMSNSALVLETKHHMELIECVRGIQTIKVANLEDARTHRFSAAMNEHLNRRTQEQTLVAVMFACQRVCLALGLVLMFFTCTRFPPTGGWTSGTVILLFGYAGQALFRGERAITAIEEFRQTRVHRDRLAEIVKTQPEAQAESADDANGGTEAGRRSAAAVTIEAQDVWFRYSPHDPWILRGVNCLFEAGRSTVIVGPTGCGKTTFIKLLLGLLEPTKGRILVDGIPLHDFGVERLRALSASVLQDDRLFTGSVIENIASFRGIESLDPVVAAARRAQIHDDVTAFPMQYYTLVDGGGSGLSGGQRQRLLLARALFAKPRIMVLDEATSHLDAAKERLISAEISALGITRIMVAHRAETIATADDVVDLGRSLAPA